MRTRNEEGEGVRKEEKINKGNEETKGQRKGGKDGIII